MQFCQKIGSDARLKVEIIDILGDEKSQFFHFLQFDDSLMARIRFNFREETTWRRKSFFLPGPDAIGSSKVWESGFGTDTRPSKDDKIVRFKYPLG
jgi:hypothetical protein